MTLFSTLIVTFGCSKAPIEVDAPKIVAKWFDTKNEFKQIDENHDISVNYFFDPQIEFNIETLSTDVVVTNLANSENKYDFDIISGKKYFSNKYCKESDVWKGYKSKIYLPPFNTGFIPRLLDQTKQIQKVIFFGDTFKKNKKKLDDRFYLDLVKVRIIGGFIEQSCPAYPCDEPSKWVSRLILVGVDKLDPKFKAVKNIKMLSNFVDLEYFKAFLENGDGRIRIQDIEFPGYKTFGEVFAENAMKYTLEKGHLFSNSEVTSLRNSCEYLYLKMKEDRQKILNKEMDFADYLRRFHQESSHNFYTCSEFVKFSSNTYDPELSWYFEYLRAFFILVKKNFIFDCTSRTWVKNYRVENGKAAYDMSKELRICNTKNLNPAFDGAISVLTSMQSTGSSYFDFIEYDSGKFGTAEKFYNFVTRNGKRQACAPKEEGRTIFPEDISWSYMPLKESEKVEVHGRKRDKSE